MNRKINVVQIGVGHDHAPMIMNAMRSHPEVFNVLGYVITEGEGLTENSKAPYKGLKRFRAEEALSLDGLDAAVIETNDYNLGKYALMAAEKGLHIHMDKQGGYDLPVFEKLIETVKAKNLVFSTGYMYRYNPLVIEALDKVKRGELGEIYSVEAQMNCLHVRAKREWLNQYKGGMTFFLGCHLVDLIYLIQGEPQDVIPFNLATEQGVGEDFGMAVFKYPRGFSFLKTTAIEDGGFMRRQLVINGSKGTIEIRPLERFIENGMQNATMRYVTLSDCEKDGWGADGTTVTSAPYHRYAPMMIRFAKAINGEAELPVTPDYELALYKVMLRSCGYKVK